jgi:hypothetical protein
MVVSGKNRRFLMHLAISAGVAVVTPAAAAGFFAGVSAAASTVADADPSIVNADPIAAPQNDSQIATHAPTRLSALAGSDDTAWAFAGRPASRHADTKTGGSCEHPCKSR